jgi:hypothetical protein
MSFSKFHENNLQNRANNKIKQAESQAQLAKSQSREIINQKNQEVDELRKQIKIMPPVLADKQKQQGGTTMRIFLKDLLQNEIKKVSEISSPQNRRNITLRINDSEITDLLNNYLKYIPEGVNTECLIKNIENFENNPTCGLVECFQQIYNEISVRKRQEIITVQETLQKTRKETAKKVLGQWYNSQKKFIESNKNNIPVLYSNFIKNSREKSMSYERFRNLMQSY